jgi:RimJ/RimL family protein N-acetyltransferase
LPICKRRHDDRIRLKGRLGAAFVFLVPAIETLRYACPMSEPDFQPTLAGPNIVVRPISSDDWPELFAAGSDPEIWKVHPVPDRYTEPGFKKFFDGAVDSNMGFVFVDRASGRLIGSSRYYGYEPELSEIEIGWTFIVRSHWGGVANREVKRLMLEHAVTFVDTVVFWVGDENWRSQGAMAKIGGIKREGLFTRELSGARPYFIFDITKRRYEQGRALLA